MATLDPRLERLLAHPALWRGRSAARSSVVPTGFAALDAALPGNGWPQTGLVEVLSAHLGVGELYVLLPAIASLSRQPAARWCAWIAPPLVPFAPALAAHGVRLGRMLVVHADRADRGERGERAVRTERDVHDEHGDRAECAERGERVARDARLERGRPGQSAGKPLWACEQALRSGACEVVLAWMRHVQPRALRRLQLATERGRTLAFLFRPLCERTLREPSTAVLRIAVEPAGEERRGDRREGEGVRVRLLKSRGGSREAVELSVFAAADA